MLTTEVENYPGFPNGIMGPELMETFRLQAERFGAVMHFVDVTKVDSSHVTPFRLWTEDDEFTADTVIVATGAARAGSTFRTRRACAAAASRPARPATARSSATSTSSSSAAATRRWKKRCSSRASAKGHRHSPAFVVSRQQDHGRSRARACEDRGHLEYRGHRSARRKRPRDSRCATSRPARRRIDADALFIAIGHDPNTALFKGQLDLDAMGYIVSPDGVTRTCRACSSPAMCSTSATNRRSPPPGGLQSRARSREVPGGPQASRQAAGTSRR